MAYNILEKFESENEQKLSQIYHQGYSQGVKDVVMTLFNQTEHCNTSIVHNGNLTREFIDAICLRSISGTSP